MRRGAAYAENRRGRVVMKAYTSLEEAAMGGKAREWNEVAADEIALVSANSDRTFDKATRSAWRSRKARSAASGRRSCCPRSSSRFGDGVVMTSQHQADSGQLLRITRVWVKRDPSTGSLGASGRWQETLSYQTAVR